MKTTVIAFILLTALAASAQTRTFRWDTELCQFQGTYNAKKYTPQQLRNTLKLFLPGEFGLNANATVFDYADVPKLSVAALDSDYKTATAALKSLDIVKVPYWENLRQRKLAEIDQVYALSRVSILVFQDRNALSSYNGAKSCKTKYAGPVSTGGDPLLAVWRSVNEDSRKRNSDPERLRREFERQHASPGRMNYALVEVMTFGWWNCANEFIKYVETDGSQEREFKKLFSRVKQIRCDTP